MENTRKLLVTPSMLAASSDTKGHLAPITPLVHPLPEAMLSLAANASDTRVGAVLQRLQRGVAVTVILLMAAHCHPTSALYF